MTHYRITVHLSEGAFISVGRRRGACWWAKGPLQAGSKTKKNAWQRPGVNQSRIRLHASYRGGSNVWVVCQRHEFHAATVIGINRAGLNVVNPAVQGQATF